MWYKDLNGGTLAAGLLSAHPPAGWKERESHWTQLLESQNSKHRQPEDAVGMAGLPLSLEGRPAMKQSMRTRWTRHTCLYLPTPGQAEKSRLPDPRQWGKS